MFVIKHNQEYLCFEKMRTRVMIFYSKATRGGRLTHPASDFILLTPIGVCWSLLDLTFSESLPLLVKPASESLNSASLSKMFVSTDVSFSRSLELSSKTIPGKHKNKHVSAKRLRQHVMEDSGQNAMIFRKRQKMLHSSYVWDKTTNSLCKVRPKTRFAIISVCA